MKNVYILCEGQTEEKFINDILYEFFILKQIYVRPILVRTKKSLSRKDKGGISSYGKIKRDLVMLCKQHPREKITTMLDFYGLPEDTPGIDDCTGGLYERISLIEKAIEHDVGCNNLVCYLCVHEFEALLFSNTDAFDFIADQAIIKELQQVKDNFASPEHINNSSTTAPSKRIVDKISSYRKVLHGNLIADKIGLNKMRQECKHFNEWIEILLSI